MDPISTKFKREIGDGDKRELFFVGVIIEYYYVSSFVLSST